MKNAKELRIGNLVTIDGVVVEIYEVTHGVIEIANGAEPYSINDIEPIPITEEWLISVGFVKQLDGNYKHPNSHEIEVFFHNRGFEVMVNSTCKNHIKHVHDVQNMYFALTGDEVL